MTNDARSRLPKWPFLFADACLLAFAVALVMLSSHPIGLWQIAACFGAVALGAVLTVAPWASIRSP